MVVGCIIDMQLLPGGAGTRGNAITAQPSRTPQHRGRQPVSTVLTASPAAATVRVRVLVAAGVVAVGGVLLVPLLVLSANVGAGVLALPTAFVRRAVSF